MSTTPANTTPEQGEYIEYLTFHLGQEECRLDTEHLIGWMPRDSRLLILIDIERVIAGGGIAEP